MSIGLCSVCNKKKNLLFKELVLSKYLVKYYLCKKCGLIQTEKPYWLKEAYSSVIADADTGLLSRNSILSKITAGIIYFLFDKEVNYLDYAGGYGVFTRMMRDMGFDYYWYDSMSKNIFAKGFEAKGNMRFQMVTAYEFLEHVLDPVREIGNIFNKYGCEAFLFSTMLYREPVDKKWWYFTYETGQHISFYDLKTLGYIAQKLDLKLYTNGVNVHIFSKKPVSKVKFYFLTKLWPLSYLLILLKMKSKTFEDHLKILDKDK